MGMRLSAEQHRALFRHPWGWLASGLGSGLSPFAPGTAGSLAALVPYLGLRLLPQLWFWIAVVVLFLLGVRASDWVTTQLKIKDPGVIVVDEWVGMWITLGLLDWRSLAGASAAEPLPYWTIIGAFFLFRATDVVKPFPANVADRSVAGGFGVMLDDVIAALWAAAIGWVLFWLWRGYA